MGFSRVSLRVRRAIIGKERKETFYSRWTERNNEIERFSFIDTRLKRRYSLPNIFRNSSLTNGAEHSNNIQPGRQRIIIYFLRCCLPHKIYQHTLSSPQI